MYYIVHATITRMVSGGKCITTVQVPTFFLHKSMQGIVDVKHAAQIAYDMLVAINPDAGICVTAAQQGDTFTMTAANR